MLPDWVSGAFISKSLLTTFVTCKSWQKWNLINTSQSN